MTFGIETYGPDGDLHFSPNYGPFNVVKTIYIDKNSSNGSTTYNPPTGRVLSFIGPAYSGYLFNYWVVKQSGNTVSWSKVGSPGRAIQIHLVSRAS